MPVCNCAKNYQLLMRDIEFTPKVFETSPDVRDEFSPRWIEFLKEDIEKVGISCPIDVSRASAWIEEAGKKVEARDYMGAADLLEAARDNVAESINECAKKE